MCKVSLIVPVYNVASYLKWCLDSIKAQSLGDFETILVDDGSTDEGGKICDEYAAGDERFKVIHQHNQGLSVARNNGTAIASGEYIGYIDSDDMIHPDYLKRLYEAATDSGSQISVSNYLRIKDEDRSYPAIESNGNNTILSGREASKEIVVEHKRFMIMACGKLYHRSLVDKLVYPVGKVNEDEFVTYRVLYETNQVVVCEDAFYGYRKRANSIINSNKSPRLDALEALNNVITYFEEKSDEEMACAARRRYLLNIQLAWFRTYISCKNKELMSTLKKSHKQFYRENRKKIGQLNFIEKSQLYVFNLSEYLYAMVCILITFVSK